MEQKSRLQALGRQAKPNPEQRVALQPGERPQYWSEHHQQVSNVKFRVQRHCGNEGAVDTADHDALKYDEASQRAEKEANLEWVKHVQAKVQARAAAKHRELRHIQQQKEDEALTAHKRLMRIKVFSSQVAANNLKQPLKQHPVPHSPSPSLIPLQDDVMHLPLPRDQTHVTQSLDAAEQSVDKTAQKQPILSQEQGQGWIPDMGSEQGAGQSEGEGEDPEEQDHHMSHDQDRQRLRWTRPMDSCQWAKMGDYSSDSDTWSESSIPLTPTIPSAVEEHPQSMYSADDARHNEATCQLQSPAGGAHSLEGTMQQEGGCVEQQFVELTLWPGAVSHPPLRVTSSSSEAGSATWANELKPSWEPDHPHADDVTHASSAHQTPEDDDDAEGNLVGDDSLTFPTLTPVQHPPHAWAEQVQEQQQQGTVPQRMQYAQDDEDYVQDEEEDQEEARQGHYLGQGQASVPHGSSPAARNAVAGTITANAARARLLQHAGILLPVVEGGFGYERAGSRPAQAQLQRDSDSGDARAAETVHITSGDACCRVGPRVVRVFSRPSKAVPGGPKPKLPPVSPPLITISLDDTWSIIRAKNKVSKKGIQLPSLCGCESGLSVFDAQYTDMCVRNCPLHHRPHLQEHLLSQMLHSHGVI